MLTADTLHCEVKHAHAHVTEGHFLVEAVVASHEEEELFLYCL